IDYPEIWRRAGWTLSGSAHRFGDASYLTETLPPIQIGGSPRPIACLHGDTGNPPRFRLALHEYEPAPCVVPAPNRPDGLPRPRRPVAGPPLRLGRRRSGE